MKDLNRFWLGFAVGLWVMIGLIAGLNRTDCGRSENSREYTIRAMASGELAYQAIDKPFLMGCCDCGLTHKTIISMAKPVVLKGIEDQGGEGGEIIAIVTWRDEVATKFQRQMKQFVCVSRRK